MHAAGSLPALTQVAQVRRLSRDEAKRNYPLRFKGVITYHSPEYRVTFVQDATAGIFIYDDASPQIGAGSQVEVEGRTTPGDFAPSIEHPKVSVVGRAPLPAVTLKSIGVLMTGKEDSQWVKTQGIVHSVTIEDRLPPDMRSGPRQLVLDIHSGNNSLKARIQAFRPNVDYSRLVDSHVVVEGVCGTLFNDRLQLVGIQLFVPGLEQLTVDRPPAADAYAPPAIAIVSLMRFDPKRGIGRRVHVRGVVTFNSRGSFFVQDDSGGVLVESEQPASADPGDLVDAAGFPTTGDSAPILKNGSVRRIGKSRPPAPRDITAAAGLASDDNNAELVRIGGRLLGQTEAGNQLLLTMELDGRTFTGALSEAAGAQRVPSIRSGSQLRLTGILWVETGKFGRSLTRQVLLRSSADITVVQAAPWLTGPRILLLLGALAGFFLVTLVRVAVLRRRIGDKTETLRAVLESTENGILAVSSEGRIVAYNRKFLEMWGLSKAVPHLASDETLWLAFARELKNPETFLGGIRRFGQDSEGTGNDVLEFQDGRVFERHSEPRRVHGKCVGRVWGFRDVTDRNRAEQRLRSLSAAVEQSPVSIVITDLRGGIEYVNPQFTAATGYAPYEVLGRNPSVLQSGETSDEEYRKLWATIESGAAWNGTFHNRRKSGQLYWAAATICAIRDETGTPTHYLAFTEDITQRRLAVEALQESGRRYRGLIENMLEGFAYCSVAFENGEAADLVYLGVNSAFEALTGLKDVVGKRITDIFPGIRDTDQGLLDAYGRVALTGKPEKLEMYVEAMRAWLSISVYCPEKGFCIAMFDVITERKRVEEANAELAAVVRFTDAAIIRKDVSGRILTWNSGAERMYGYSASEMIGRFTSTLLPPERVEELKSIEESLILGRDVSHFETVRITKAGERIDVMMTVSLMRDSAGDVAGYAHIAWNISARKRLERQLSQAQKLESIGQLAAGIAHEINTPIQYIGDNARFLGDAFQDLFKAIGQLQAPPKSATGADSISAPPLECPSDIVDVDYLRQEVPAAIAQLEEGVANVARIVRAMKEFSHPGPAEKVAVDINRALDSTILVCRNEWKYVADLKSEFDPELPLVPCVAGEINQVFLNLIVNAAHAIGDSVRDNGQKGAITVSTRRSGDWAEIRVRDTGTGIPEEIRPRIFDPFFTTKEVGKGTGQGLAIAHSVVVQKHQGAIDFESCVGAGTTFLVRLPLGSLN